MPQPASTNLLAYLGVTSDAFFILCLSLLLRRGEDAQLAHQPQSVPVVPVLGHLALGGDAAEGHPRYPGAVAGGGDAHQLSLVGGARRPARQRPVPFGDCSSTTKRRSGNAPKSRDRKSTRLNSSHANISYAVFCLNKKNIF